MFVDEYVCTFRSGHGGPGCISFRREKYVPRGGPDGGDGGDGGSVLLVANPSERTLYPLVGQRLFAAENGRPGTSANCYGSKGADLVLQVPVGTMLYDAERGNLLKDLVEPGVPFVICVRASPKSMSFAPDLVIITLPGLKSRWTIPAR